MDGVDQGERRRRSLKERLGFKGMGCCGATWGGLRPTTLSVQDDAEEGREQELLDAVETPAGSASGDVCAGETRSASGMNLAAALAAERELRAAQDSDGGASPLRPTNGRPSSETASETPLRVSLMRLMEETEGSEGERETAAGEGSDSVCCVCMGRKKGAAFIPCGHTFCRVCSRELWLNRGTCPICNRQILEILDLF
ncbi:uncharacterized protein LOC127808358 [Diospyros lotus]|uniref:uncharacterized protein LOC127808358 n=1 Tax=Diospyros lotus TaxID=55363 RepID=UPI0022521052|nr:uncharacterized protein LOC127808358 [Diospyros lotus]